MKKFVLFVYLFIAQYIFAQDLFSPNDSLDKAINQIWDQGNSSSLQDIGVESLGRDRELLAPLLPPTRSRQIPGTEQIVIPVEETEGPLNLAPNDARAYILYNRATIAFRNKQYENARNLYRELVKKYPDSSYSPYALYVLSLSEQDYRRKIRILLTIKERFPNFMHKDIVLDRLGDIYYLLESPEASEEVFVLSKSPYALYMRALIAMDASKPNKAISLVRDYLKTRPNNEAAYQAYMLYAEALIHIKGYDNALVILQKATELRPWAYDNGGLILFNAGKALYHNKQYDEALYAFSLLRLRFPRSSESRISDQYLTSLNKKSIVSMKSVPWLATSFDTIIKEQPVMKLKTPKAPSIADILEINNIPKSAVPEPEIDNITFLPPMPIPVPSKTTYDLLMPLTDATPRIELITLTNTVYQELTNEIQTFITNRVFVVETNTVTNNITGVVFSTNILTNVIQTWETNTVVSYEPVILWRTNYQNIDITNLVTNVIDVVVTNERIELNYLWKTNYSFENRPQSITNEIIRYITNRYLEYSRPNAPPEWKENIVEKKFLEIIPAWKSAYSTLDTDQLVTNVIREVKTNQRLELVPRWVDNVRTNDGYRVVDTIITNTRLRIAPRWITNFQVIQTNMRDVVITNVQNVYNTNVREQIVTNLLNITYNNTNTITNISEREITNYVDITRNKTNVVTNLVQHHVTNLIYVPYQATNVATNFVNHVITNYINSPYNQTNVITNRIQRIVTNYINQTVYKTNVITNTTRAVATNLVFPAKGSQIFITNLREIVLTNNTGRSFYQTNNLTNLREVTLTNYDFRKKYITNFITNLREVVITNTTYMSQGGELVITNIVEKVITNFINTALFQTNVITNLSEKVVTNFINMSFNDDLIITNLSEAVITNFINDNRYETNFITNLIEKVITNKINRSVQRTNVITNLSEFVITNSVNIPYNTVNIKTNIIEYLITNYINKPFDRTNIITNLVESVITNQVIMDKEDNIVITNNLEGVITNVINNSLNTTNIFTNMSDYIITNMLNLQNNQIHSVSNTMPYTITNVYNQTRQYTNINTNMIDRVITNLLYMPQGGTVYYTNTFESVVTNFVNRPFDKTNISTNYEQYIITNVLNNTPDQKTNIFTNITEILSTNIIYIPYGGLDIRTNSQQYIITNQINRPFVQTNIITNTVGYNFLERNALLGINSQFESIQKVGKFQEINQDPNTSEIEYAPTERVFADEKDIEGEEQVDLIEEEPVYDEIVEEEQVKLLSDYVLQLEEKAAKLTEKSASIAGKYSFSDNKGFVVRIAQVKDLSVANIIVKDVNNLNLGVDIGIYYRDKIYYVEIRSLKDQKKAQNIAQKLYENGYTDVQLFEQYEVVEYQDS